MNWVVVAAVTQRGGSVGWAAAGACVAATALGGLRWLRVAQREHYLPDSASRFALRWWRASAVNALGALLGLAGLVLAARWPIAALAPAAVVALGPHGLGLRGRTSPLRWTRRLRTLAGVWGGFQLGVALGGLFSGFGAVICAAGALAVPAVVDLACLATAPFERALANRYVRRAGEQLRRVRPKVVGITGSYGKTSTKAYVAHLVSGAMAAVASPASFNNRAGLARAVNEHLWVGTEVFVAEMGTYGPGEIAALCSWMPPDVAVITAIGPVHLERFGSEEAIVTAKSEILTRAASCVLMVDDPRLAAVADAAQASGRQRVWRVSGKKADHGPAGDVDVRVVEDEAGMSVWTHGKELATGVTVAARPGNVACAVAVALDLGVPAAEISERLATLPVAPHRLEPHTAGGGFAVLDDTYNANPAGTRAALQALSASGAPHGRKVVVTPGMVELSRRQAEENAAFAEAAGAVATDLLVVGRTNRRALVRGFQRAGAPRDRRPPLTVARRDEAVAWVRENLGPDDAVLYENDLPDHYP